MVDEWLLESVKKPRSQPRGDKVLLVTSASGLAETPLEKKTGAAARSAVHSPVRNKPWGEAVVEEDGCSAESKMLKEF